MPVRSSPKRETFRHGNLAEALIGAALKRVATDGVEAISLRDLARDVGVNHRAVYRHFPDKLSLLARVAEHGWRQLGVQATKSTTGKPAGEEALIGASLSLLHFAQAHPNLYH